MIFLYGAAIASILAFAFFFLLILKRTSQCQSHQSLPPGSFGLPFVGETLHWLRKRDKGWEFCDERNSKYGPVFKTSILGSPTVLLAAPAGNKFVYSNENKLVVNSWPSSVARLLGEHSFTLKIGEDHKQFRQILMTFLKTETVQKSVGKVSKLALEHLTRHWDGSSHVKAGKLMSKFTFSVACKLFLSLEDDGQLEKLKGPFEDFCGGIMQLPLNLPWTNFGKALIGRRRILELFDDIIAVRKQDLAGGVVAKDQDVLSVLLTTCDANGEFLSDAQIKDNILLLLFAGHDTSSSTLTMMIKVLAEHPEWMNNILQENLVLASQQEKLDTKKMLLTWRVLQETLRLYPPVPGAMRLVIKDFEYGGFFIPKGWKLYWTSNLSHRRQEFFPEPHMFNPLRFEGDGPPPFTWVPFGGGPRTCPGQEFAKMEILVFIHHLITRYSWTMVDAANSDMQIKIQRR